MEVNISMNDWERAEQIRHIATGIVEHITHNQNVEAVQNLVNFAGLIYSKDMSEYAKTKDTKDINSEIKSVEFSLKADIRLIETNLTVKIDTVESNLNSKIDKVESSLNVKIDKVESGLNSRIDTVESNLNAKIDTVESNLNAKIDKVELNLNTRIDKVESNLKSDIRLVETNLRLGFETKILESQNTLIKWFISLFLTQFTGMVFLFLKLSGKF
ncbi:MAG: Bdr family protein [Alphaproteobacteria bacterium]